MDPATSPSSSSRPHHRGISFSGKSDKSRRSSNSGGPKVVLSSRESAEEKHRRSLQTKADPTLAMSEAQPAVVALEKSNMGSLRSIQHKDQYGNVITDPDLSNPTRPRFERPLDTIRAFEAAIDGSYHSRRMSYVTEASPSRPNSYYGNNDPNGYSHNPHASRPSRPRHGNSRMNSEYGGQNVYSTYQPSSDNFNGSTDPWGNEQQQNYYSGGPPPPPHKRQSFNPPVGGAGGGGGGGSGVAVNPALPAPVRRTMDDDDKKKRGSWLKRRFTKDKN